jgi:medium-chain acyl-[acyl-carrier-protein] hydrolase
MLTNASPRDNSWLVTLRPGRPARMRLICFPYAGAGASIFRSWAGHLPEDIEICSIQFPGKERRLGEPPPRRLPVVAADFAALLARTTAQSYSLFGYSLGALIAFELARNLRAYGCAGPAHLFVAAHRAPQLPSTHKKIHHLPRAEFIEELTRFDGTPESVLRNPDLMDVLLPGIQADFEMYETYAYRPDLPLACPITAFGGDADRSVPHHALEAWRCQTTGPFRSQLFPGGHFFLNQMLPALLCELNRDLRSSIRRFVPGWPASQAAARSVPSIF